MASGKPSIGFIGTGIMGTPMVRCLLAAGHAVSVWNRSRDKTTPLVSDGAQLAESPASLVAATDVICLCISDTAAVEAVVFGADGIAGQAGSCQVLVDFSSIKPDATVDMAERLEAANGMQWVDAPVSGGAKGAAAGTLVIFCGGKETVIDSVRPVFEAVGSRWTRMGEVGAGQATKLCNQAIVAANLVAIAESMRLAKAAGIDVEGLPAALAGGWADSQPLQIIGPSLAAAPGGPKIGALSMMLKDVDSVLEFAAAAGSELPVVAHAAEIYRQACEAGFGDADLSALGEYLGIRRH